MGKLAKLRDRHYWARARRRKQRELFREAIRRDKLNVEGGGGYGDLTTGWITMVTIFSSPMVLAVFHPELLGLAATPLALGVGLMSNSDKVSYILRLWTGKVDPRQEQIGPKTLAVESSALSTEDQESSH